MQYRYFNEGIKCPSCKISSQPLVLWEQVFPSSLDGIPKEKMRGSRIVIALCPKCLELLFLRQDGGYVKPNPNRDGIDFRPEFPKSLLFYPPRGKLQLSPDIPEEYGKIAKEAHACRDISPTASALLSRRLLQKVLREKYKVLSEKREAGTWTNLIEEIKDFLKSNPYAATLRPGLEHIRQFGNIAAHPPGAEESVSITEIGTGEAKYLLDFIVKKLFQVAFIDEAEQKRMDALLNPSVEVNATSEEDAEAQSDAP